MVVAEGNFRIQRKRLVELADGGNGAIGIQISAAEQDVRKGHRRLEANGSLQGFTGRLVLFRTQISEGQIQVRFVLIRKQLRGFEEFPDGRLRLAALKISKSHQMMRLSVIRPEPNGLLGQFQAAGLVAQAKVTQDQSVPGILCAGCIAPHLLEATNRCREISLVKSPLGFLENALRGSRSNLRENPGTREQNSAQEGGKNISR